VTDGGGPSMPNWRTVATIFYLAKLAGHLLRNISTSSWLLSHEGVLLTMQAKSSFASHAAEAACNC
jgi:hypothetical protein